MDNENNETNETNETNENKNIVLGTMNIDYPHSSLSENERNLNTYSNIIETYIQKCIIYDMDPILDTAYYYGNTKTEQSLGHIFSLGDLSMIPKIATKANPWLNNDFTTGQLGQLSEEGIYRQLTTSLKNLQLDPVLHQILVAPYRLLQYYNKIEILNYLQTFYIIYYIS